MDSCMFDLTFFEKWTRKMSQRMYPISVSKRARVSNPKRNPAPPAQYLSSPLGSRSKTFWRARNFTWSQAINFVFFFLRIAPWAFSRCILQTHPRAKQTYCAQTVSFWLRQIHWAMFFVSSRLPCCSIHVHLIDSCELEIRHRKIKCCILGKRCLQGGLI